MLVPNLSDFPTMCIVTIAFRSRAQPHAKQNNATNMIPWVD